ncbi:FAD-dependent oxidoreductase [Fundidesulfovibrio butyratiphilus]
MPDYDVIVVGAGLAGSTAAYCMAKEGLSVLMLERGDTPGSKNVTGGRLYGHSLEKVIPGFADKAPVQRMVTRETISLMTADSSFNLDFQSRLFGSSPSAASYTVLRSEFDAWLAGEAENAGCDVVCPARVDSLLKENGKITGVVAGDDTLTCDMVILADGVNSLLAQKEGLKKELSPHEVGVGAKEIIQLSEQVINDRFGVTGNEGVARLFAGDPSEGQVGGGFIYTNKDTLCLGVVVTVDQISTSKTRLPDLVERFKSHPAVAPLVEGGKVVEYSAHLVPEGGLKMVPELVADNLLVVGDAAALCVNLGFTVRGMDYAIASGQMAAETVIEAKAKGDYSKAGLAGYKQRLEQSFVLKDLNTYRHAPEFIEGPRTYTVYPDLVEKIFVDLFRVTGEPAVLARKKLLPHVLKAGVFGFIKDAWKGGNAV